MSGQPINSFIVKLSDQLMAMKEELIKEAITHGMGTDEWSFSDLDPGRAELNINPAGVETFTFDGKEMFILKPPQVDIERNEQLSSFAMAGFQEIQILWE